MILIKFEKLKKQNTKFGKTGDKMSKRRTLNEWVIISENTGFIITNSPTKVKLYRYMDSPCMMGCDDIDCQEWDAIDENNCLYCHVTECEMTDSEEK